MELNLKPIRYKDLNARQKENYNFLKLSSMLAGYGYMTMRLNDDWQGADFIAQHVTDNRFLKIQLKSRLSFGKKYRGKDIYVAFHAEGKWYLYPHDEALKQVRKVTDIETTESWIERGAYSFPRISREILPILTPWEIFECKADHSV